MPPTATLVSSRADRTRTRRAGVCACTATKACARARPPETGRLIGEVLRRAKLHLALLGNPREEAGIAEAVRRVRRQSAVVRLAVLGAAVAMAGVLAQHATLEAIGVVAHAGG